MSPFIIGNLILLASLLCTAGAQVILKALFNEHGVLHLDASLLTYLNSPIAAVRLVIALLLSAAGFVTWLLCLSRLNLSYAYTVVCSSALFVNVFSVIFLGEAVPARLWLGTALIVAGTMLVVPAARA